MDRELKGVVHVIVDEIYERGMNEYFLLIVLKYILPRRSDLKLILISELIGIGFHSIKDIEKNIRGVSLDESSEY